MKKKQKQIITPRQEKILKKIIEEYTDTAQPISSHQLKEKSFQSLSSATIRNDMSILEDYGLIVKNYSSSGRIPTTKGYQYYNDYLNHDIIPENIKIQINDLMSKRNLSIDEIIKQSVDIISKYTSLMSVSTNNYHKDLLKKIDLIVLNENSALFIIVTSSGNLIKKEIDINDPTNIEDVSICVNIFNDRLVNTPLSEIQDKLDLLKEIIKGKIKSYEYVIQEIVNKIFKGIDWVNVHVGRTEQALVHPEFSDIKKLKKLLILLNDVSVWKQIALNRQINGKTSINFNDSTGIEDISIASTNIDLKTSSHEISMIGPERVTKAKAKILLEFLKKEIERNYK